MMSLTISLHVSCALDLPVSHVPQGCARDVRAVLFSRGPTSGRVLSGLRVSEAKL